MFFFNRKTIQCTLNEHLPLSTPLEDLTFTVFDTETTGFRIAGEDRLIEIGAVQVKGLEVMEFDTFQTYVNPNRQISQEIFQLTGISDEIVQAAPCAYNAIREFFQFVERRESVCFVGHYVTFDMMALKQECKRADLHLKKHFAIDTLDLIGIMAPSYDMRDLERYARSFGSRIYKRHTAVGDALTTAYLFTELLYQLKMRNYQTWGDLLEGLRSR